MNEIIEKENIDIENMIYEIRGMEVMLDSDLAKLYQVETKRINEAVYRNEEKFPNRISWVTSDAEVDDLWSQNATANISKKSRSNPRVFTEQGVYMLATILKSKVATQVSIAIMDTFKELLDILKKINKEIIIVSKNIDATLKKKYEKQYKNVTFICLKMIMPNRIKYIFKNYKEMSNYISFFYCGCYNKKYLVIVMYIEGFGKKKIKLFIVDGTSELLGLEFIHKFKKYYGVIDNKGRLLTPITDKPIIEVFATKDRKDYCFTRQNSEEDFESFHVQKGSDGKFHLKAHIAGNEVTKCRIIGTEKDNYWFITSITDGIEEVCLYDVKKAKITTPLFTEISFEEEDSRVLAYVEKEIYAEIDGEMVYLTSLLSFIDRDGDFVAPLYDPEIDLFYEAINYNIDKSFKSFNRTLDSIRQIAVNRYNDKNNHVTEILANMYTNLYSVKDVKTLPKKAKIIEFRRDSNDDEK